jgi:hypothetical protein
LANRLTNLVTLCRTHHMAVEHGSIDLHNHSG